MDIWQILDLEPTSDQKAIKRAYVTRLKQCHPEDDQAGFIELNTAYEYAKRYAEYEHEEYLYDSNQSGDTSEFDAEPLAEPISDEPVEANGADIPEHVSEFVNFFALREDVNASVFGRGELDFSSEENNAIDALGEKLNEIFEDVRKFKNAESWHQIFENPVLESPKIRRYFAYDFFEAMAAHIKKHRELNHLTPSVALVIANYFVPQEAPNDTVLVGEHLAKIESMREIAHVVGQVIHEQQKQRNSWWLFKIMLTPMGRITRMTYFSMLSILTIGYYFIALANIAEAGTSRNAQDQIFDISTLESENTDSSELFEPAPETYFEDLPLQQRDYNGETQRKKEYIPPYFGKQNQSGGSQKKKAAIAQSALNVSESKVDEVMSYLPRYEGHIKPIWIITSISVWVMFCLTSRRFHDTGQSAWLVLMAFIPYIGVLGIAIYVLLPSDVGENKYGVYPGPWQETLGEFRVDMYRLFRQVN